MRGAVKVLMLIVAATLVTRAGCLVTRARIVRRRLLRPAPDLAFSTRSGGPTVAAAKLTLEEMHIKNWKPSRSNCYQYSILR